MADRTLSVKIIGDERDLIRAFGRSTRATRQFEAQMSGVSRRVRNVFAAAGVALGATAIVQAFRSTISAAIDFESSFAGVRKTVDATEPQLQALARGFRELSKEIPVSVDELNRIGEAAGQLGVQRGAILDFTETIAAIGVSTNLASDQAADAFARLANITQIPQDQFDNLGSTVVDLGNKLAATESEITDFGLRIAAAGKIVGLTVDETLAIAGAFSSVGVEAEAGGTAVSKVFISLANAVKTGGKQLQLFADTAGSSTAEFRRQFETNTSGAFVSFVEGLKRVDAEGGNVFKTLKDLGLTDVRLVRAFLSISQSGDLLTRSLAIGSRAWDENSALQIEAAKRYETTASKLQIFQNRVNDLQITLGNVLAPALLEIITPLGKWLESTENQERVQRALIDTMEDARAIFEGVRAVVVPLAEGVKSLADRMGGLKNMVELLLVAMVAAKVVAFGTALTGLGTSALVATGKVSALRLALLRLGAIGVIALGVELVLNRKEIEQWGADVHRRVEEFFGGGGVEIPLEPKARLGALQELRKRLLEFTGPASDEVRSLDSAIEKLLRRIQSAQGTVRPDDRGGARGPGAIEAENREAERAAQKAAARIKAAEQLKSRAAENQIRTDEQIKARATDAAVKATKTSTDKILAAEKREAARLEAQRRAQAQRQRRVGLQLEALGLTADGQQRAPGVGALRGRLANLREQLKGTALDTDKTRSQLDQIAKVLKGKFGAVGRDVRLAILDMFNQIASGFKEGSQQTEGSSTGEITRGGIRSTQRLLRGLDLSEEERRLLQQRNLGVSGRRGLSAFGVGIGDPTTFATGGARGAVTAIPPIHITLEIDGQKMSSVVVSGLQKKARRSSGGRRGRHGGANLGMQ